MGSELRAVREGPCKEVTNRKGQKERLVAILEVRREIYDKINDLYGHFGIPFDAGPGSYALGWN
jgi:hypothetical protein